MELYENNENSNYNYKNIDCIYKIKKYNISEEKLIDKDILHDISLQNFNNLIDNIQKRENERIIKRNHIERMEENHNYMKTQKLRLKKNWNVNGKEDNNK